VYFFCCASETKRSFSGTIARVFAGEHPDEVKGIVFVDVLTPELRAQMTREEWKIWKRINARPAKALAAYLSEVCPALTASTTMRMAWMTTGALSHDVVSVDRANSAAQTSSRRSCPARCTSPTRTRGRHR
jgi:pimeloyl-ACP methyl ester carboxylesterase